MKPLKIAIELSPKVYANWHRYRRDRALAAVPANLTELFVKDLTGNVRMCRRFAVSMLPRGICPDRCIKIDGDELREAWPSVALIP